MNKKKYIIILFMIGFSLFSFNFNNVIASDDDGDEIDDEFEDLNKRQLSYEIEDSEIQIQSKLRSGNQIDEIEMKITNDTEGLGIDISYEEDISSSNTSEIEFGVRFRKLIEFVDLDSNSIYDPLIDKKIQEINLTSFQPAIFSQFNISDDTRLYYFLINSTDGIFTAHIYFTEEFHVINGTLTTPIQSKLDIEISNFPYINDSSKIALYTSLESEVEYEEEDDTEDEINDYAIDEKGITTRMNDFTGQFTWRNNATIDGISREVFISDLDVDDYDGDDQKMYLTYSRGMHIYHDPKVGIAGIYKFKITPDNPLFLLILIIGIISSLSISIGYSIYRYRERSFESQYKKLKNDKSNSEALRKSVFESKKLGDLLNNKKLLDRLKETPFDKLSSNNDIKLTALSQDFYKLINLFDWEEDELVNFVNEMISLTPEERNTIFKEMLDKSEQQKKSRLDDTKGLYI